MPPSDVLGGTISLTLSSLENVSLVEDPNYRDTNLAANDIFMRPLHEQLPKHIADLFNYIRRDRYSPGPSLDQVRHNVHLDEPWMGAGEAEIENYFKLTSKMFPKPEPLGSRRRNEKQPMAKRAIPTRSELRVNTPAPDILYEYSRHRAFPQQQSQLMSMGDDMVATNQFPTLLYPFFVVEFKGDGGRRWGATNQCLGGAASCVNTAEGLNSRLGNYSNDKTRYVNSAAFSISAEVRLNISWKHNKTDYYTASVRDFFLRDPSHHIELWKCVRNIIDWGAGQMPERVSGRAR